MKQIKASALAALLALGGIGGQQALAGDTNATTVAYWQLGATVADANSPSGFSFADLATNAGQGSLTGSLPNLWIEGPINGSPTLTSAVPPSSMINASGGFNSGAGSWDAGADSMDSEMACDNGAFGPIFNTPSYTEEIIFKTDYSYTTNSVLGNTKQTLIWNHQHSAYGFLQLNETSNGTNLDDGSLLFFAWNVANFPFVRITAAQNGGQRFDDGNWHYVCCRYDGNALTMDILAVNQDGTWTESKTYINEPLNPGGSGSQGPFIVGNDESGTVPLYGLINQVRFSSAALPNSQLLVNVSGCNPITLPPSASVPSTNAVAVGSVLNLAPIDWFNTGFPQGNQVQGGPFQYQWQVNDANLAGQTNISLNLYPASVVDSGNYQLIVSSPCGSLSVTTAPVTVQVTQAINLTRWGFNFVEANTYPQATVDDLEPNFTNVYDLITFNNSPNVTGIGSNGEIPLTNDVAPASMFINGNNGGANAFDAGYLAGNDGVVFYPAGPDVFDFQGSFALECFFRTYGDQSASGTMELLCQGTDGGNTFRYGVNLNQAGAGTLTFNINNYSLAPTGPSYEDFNNPAVQAVVISNANYADGNWHYVLAQYNSSASTIALSVANADGTGTNATVALPTGYSPLAANAEGNFFVGRYRYPWSDDNRNFTGEIDEVQVSAGVVDPKHGQLGYLAGEIEAPYITGISAVGGTVTIKFTGGPADAASAFTLIGSSNVNGTYSPLNATINKIGTGSFQATVAASGSAHFYRIKR